MGRDKSFFRLTACSHGLERKKFIIAGPRVHGIGYRVFLINIALELGIDKMTAYNTFLEEKEAVIAIIEGDHEQVGSFSKLIRERTPEGAQVSFVREESYKGRVPSIDRTMAAFQTEHWGKAIPILIDMRAGIKRVEAAVREESEKTREELKGVRADVREFIIKEIGEIKKRLDRLEKSLSRFF